MEVLDCMKIWSECMGLTFAELVWDRLQLKHCEG